MIIIGNILRNVTLVTLNTEIAVCCKFQICTNLKQADNTSNKT